MTLSFPSRLNMKITALVAATTLSVLTVSFLFIAHLEQKKAIEQMKRQSAILGDSIQRAVLDAFRGAQNSQVRLTEFLRKIGDLEGVERVEIFGPDLTLIVKSRNLKNVQIRYSALVPKILESGIPLENENSGSIIQVLPAYGSKQGRKVSAVVAIAIRREGGSDHQLVDVIGQAAESEVGKALADFSKSREAMEAVINDMGKREGIDHLDVFDSAGDLIAHSPSDRIERRDSFDGLWFAQALATGKVVEIEKWKEHQYEQFIPIVVADGAMEKPVAVAEVAFDTKTVAASIQKIRLQGLFITMGITFLLSTLLTIFLERLVTQRILGLAEMVHRVSSGDFRSLVNDLSPDEIGQLGRDFNLMSEKLEKARSILEKELEAQKEIDRLKDSFLAMVSHELRTPLTAVIGFSNAILEGYAGEITAKQRDLIQEIQGKGEHLSLLINNLLDLEKIRGGQMEMSFEEASLEKIVDRSISMVQAQAQKKGVELIRVFSVDLPPVRVDSMKTQSVITNLLDNAVKFTPTGGKVQIFVQFSSPRESRQDFVEVLVSDTGIGIPPSEQDKIFDRFYQVEGETTRTYPGTGLGLALAREFALLHGGWLKVRGNPGWATTFSFGLPLDASLASNIHLQKTIIDLPSMLQGIIHLFRNEESDSIIQFDPPSEKEMEKVLADRTYLRSILINILQNCFRYRDKGTPVKISIIRAEEMLEIVIENQGPAFPYEEIKKIFSRERGEKESSLLASYSRNLSLRAAAEILQNHGGALKIENFNNIPKGSAESGVRFILQLPHLRPTLAHTGGKHVEKENLDH